MGGVVFRISCIDGGIGTSAGAFGNIVIEIKW